MTPWMQTGIFTYPQCPILPNLTDLLFFSPVSLVEGMIQKCPNLQNLVLINKSASDDSFPRLRGLQHLTTLSIFAFGMIGDELTKLPSLTELTIQTFMLAPQIQTNSCLAKTLARTNIQILHLRDNNPDFVFVRSILDEVQLTRLHFRYDHFVFGELFDEFIDYCTAGSNGIRNPTSLWIDFLSGRFIDGETIAEHDYRI